MNNFFSLYITNNEEGTGYEILGCLLGHEFSLNIDRNPDDCDRYWQAKNHQKWIKQAYEQYSRPIDDIPF